MASELDRLKAAMNCTFENPSGESGVYEQVAADAVIAHLEAEIERVTGESKCPCCKGGVSITGEPCQECHGKALVSIAYETTRFQYKRLESRLAECQERERKLREALTTAKYRICCDYCPPDGSHAGLCETISAH